MEVKREKRIAEDGHLYTWLEFLDWYGDFGATAWDDAKRPFECHCCGYYIKNPRVCEECLEDHHKHHCMISGSNICNECFKKIDKKLAKRELLIKQKNRSVSLPAWNCFQGHS